MANKTQTIRIESILGGHSPTTHFAAGDQFLSSVGIDPSLPMGSTANDLGVSGGIGGNMPSGLIRPVAIEGLGTTVARPMWITNSPKNGELLFVYDSGGSIYTSTESFGTLTGLGDLNDGGSASGNGIAYYDNYVYFARDTTVARYGPLNGTPSFADDYWVTTLGKAALTNTTYPKGVYWDTIYPNHVLHRHSDGKLYIADVVDNQGTIHYIKTKKTSVEGDTDDGSTYDKVSVGYGLWPTAMESYGDLLVIAFIEIAVVATGAALKSERAKIAFWDTSSENINSITWSEYPDDTITALKNVNGVLHVLSGNNRKMGSRLMRYTGGNSFEHLAFIPAGDPPAAGSVDGDSNRMIFGSWTYAPAVSGSVYSYGLSMIKPDGLFNIMPVTGYNADNTLGVKDVSASAVKLLGNSLLYSISEPSIVAGYSNGATKHGVVAAISKQSSSNELCNAVFWSQIYRIGQPFKITKIRVQTTEPLASSASVDIGVRIDSNMVYKTVGSLSQTDWGQNRQSFVFRPRNLTADDNFILEISFKGQRTVVSLPITIEYELLDVDTAYP